MKSLVQQLMPAFTVLIILSSVSVAVVMYLKHRHYLYDQFRENIAKIKDDQHNRSV
ncbi:MAG: hypothetical protein IE884_06860 [Sulfuricurvum sp.]|nr:hypothetical protein [Sulfuricurvum sp.]